ncbi:MAG: hypothetical protein B6D63_06660 [Candidatus Latescibacteria bacterium 4484_7]|nr:MAG: hypothetical protein B6D63_06660 [Candidatus Latescibacteria bacterium 4484_7]
MKIEFYKHSVGKEEIERVNSVLNSLFLTTGDEVAEFEQRLADYLALPYTVAVTSCTAGMHLALIAAGLKPGEEVVTTPLTFIGTANSILMAGGVPVFADVEMSTGNIDPTKIEEVITDKTRGIMPVHIYGQMCDMDTITEIAERHGLFVIEDAAHSLEGRWRGKASGYYGDYAAFSFYATKNITSGEGGAISVKGEESYELLKKLRLHGLEKTAGQYPRRAPRRADKEAPRVSCASRGDIQPLQRGLLQHRRNRAPQNKGRGRTRLPPFHDSRRGAAVERDSPLDKLSPRPSHDILQGTLRLQGRDVPRGRGNRQTHDQPPSVPSPEG